MSEKQSLPPEESDHRVVDISLRHVIVAFGSLVGASFAVGVSIVFVRDYTKLRRQKAIIEAATELLRTIQNPNNERGENWNTKKKQTATPSTLVTKK